MGLSIWIFSSSSSLLIVLPNLHGKRIFCLNLSQNHNSQHPKHFTSLIQLINAHFTFSICLFFHLLPYFTSSIKLQIRSLEALFSDFALVSKKSQNCKAKILKNQCLSIEHTQDMYLYLLFIPHNYEKYWFILKWQCTDQMNIQFKFILTYEWLCK